MSLQHSSSDIEQEQQAFKNVILAFSSYRQNSIFHLEKKKSDISSLSFVHRSLLRNLAKTISICEDRVIRNSIFINQMLGDKKINHKPTDDPSPEVDMDKVRSVLRQMVRDWSLEGISERHATYNPILEQLQEQFPNEAKRSSLRVLVPGSGLSRLAWEIANLGFSCEGNEFSFFMLIASDFIINQTTCKNEFEIYPWIHSFSNQRSIENITRMVKIPDVVTNSLASDVDFSIVGGDFTELYSKPEQMGKWDAIVTCFFVDTGNNICEYLDIIYRALKPNGIWINLGPLLYHFEGRYQETSVEPDLETVEGIIEAIGFKITKKKDISCRYAGNSKGMLEYVYNSRMQGSKKDQKMNKNDVLKKMDDLEDILYGNLDEAPLLDSLQTTVSNSKKIEIKTSSTVISPAEQESDFYYENSNIPINHPETKSVISQPIEIKSSIENQNIQNPPITELNTPKQGKMFIGGLSWETSDEALREYMSAFGEIDECLVMKDPLTNKSRGFAFLTFANTASIDKVVQSDHYLDGKKIDPKRAVPKDEYEKAEKMFVGGVPIDVQDPEFRDYFKQFGIVTDATIMNDRATGRSRGFGFVTFSNWDSVQNVLNVQSREGLFINGKRVEAKPASLRAQSFGMGIPGQPGQHNYERMMQVRPPPIPFYGNPGRPPPMPPFYGNPAIAPQFDYPPNAPFDRNIDGHMFDRNIEMEHRFNGRTDSRMHQGVIHERVDPRMNERIDSRIYEQNRIMDRNEQSHRFPHDRFQRHERHPYTEHDPQYLPQSRRGMRGVRGRGQYRPY